MTLLERIENPRDLKHLSQAELKSVAQEIRQFILEKVALNGGHLASNLGVVELTIALHYVYNSPVDNTIWDVGHQCYVHKILPRREQFDTLRQFGGISGFPKRKSVMMHLKPATAVHLYLQHWVWPRHAILKMNPIIFWQ